MMMMMMGPASQLAVVHQGVPQQAPPYHGFGPRGPGAHVLPNAAWSMAPVGMSHCAPSDRNGARAVSEYAGSSRRSSTKSGNNTGASGKQSTTIGSYSKLHGASSQPNTCFSVHGGPVGSAPQPDGATMMESSFSMLRTEDWHGAEPAQEAASAPDGAMTVASSYPHGAYGLADAAPSDAYHPTASGEQGTREGSSASAGTAAAAARGSASHPSDAVEAGSRPSTSADAVDSRGTIPNSEGRAASSAHSRNGDAAAADGDMDTARSRAVDSGGGATTRSVSRSAERRIRGAMRARASEQHKSTPISVRRHFKVRTLSVSSISRDR